MLYGTPIILEASRDDWGSPLANRRAPYGPPAKTRRQNPPLEELGIEHVTFPSNRVITK